MSNPSAVESRKENNQTFLQSAALHKLAARRVGSSGEEKSNLHAKKRPFFPLIRLEGVQTVPVDGRWRSQAKRSVEAAGRFHSSFSRQTAGALRVEGAGLADV